MTSSRESLLYGLYWLAGLGIKPPRARAARRAYIVKCCRRILKTLPAGPLPQIELDGAQYALPEVARYLTDILARSRVDRRIFPKSPLPGAIAFALTDDPEMDVLRFWSAVEDFMG